MARQIRLGDFFFDKAVAHDVDSVCELVNLQKAPYAVEDIPT